MTSLYEIFVYDDNLVNYGLLQGFEYLEFSQRVSSPWNHNIRFKTNNASALASFFRGADGMIDWPIFIYRTDPVTDLRHLVYEGLNRTIVDQLDLEGNSIFNLYGVGFTELLQRRIILPPVGEEHLTFTGKAETVIKDFVDSQCINPYDPTRVIPGLSIEVDSQQGSDVAYSGRYTILNTAVTRCAVDGGLDFGIVGGNPDTVLPIGEFELQVRPLWGIDRSISNTDGNEATILDNTLGTMSIPIYSVNSSGEKNYVYVGGQGQGVNRDIAEVSDATAIASSPWNRREDFSDARMEATAAGLALHGQNLLYNNKTTRNLTFNIVQSLSCRWGTEWNLGDIITSKYFTIQYDQKITQITARISALGNTPTEFISVEFEQLT